MPEAGVAAPLGSGVQFSRVAYTVSTALHGLFLHIYIYVREPFMYYLTRGLGDDLGLYS